MCFARTCNVPKLAHNQLFRFVFKLALKCAVNFVFTANTARFTYHIHTHTHTHTRAKRDITFCTAVGVLKRACFKHHSVLTSMDLHPVRMLCWEFACCWPEGAHKACLAAHLPSSAMFSAAIDSTAQILGRSGC